MNIDKFLIRAEAENGQDIHEGYYRYNSKKHYIALYGSHDNYNLSFSIKPETIKRCTGYRDKNGKLIFEGDIVRDTRNNIFTIDFCKYNNAIGFTNKDLEWNIIADEVVCDSLAICEIIKSKEERFEEIKEHIWLDDPIAIFKDKKDENEICFYKGGFTFRFDTDIDKETLDFINQKVKELNIFEEE